MKLALTSAQRWPAAIVAVLLAQVVFGAWMSHVASDDPHFAVEPNYYARAVNWDSTMAQARVDQATGWRATATLARAAGSPAILHIALVDSVGAAAVADTVTAELRAIAHSNDVTRLTLTRDSTGYSAPVADAGHGLWEVQLRAIHRRALFTAKLRTELQ